MRRKRHANRPRADKHTNATPAEMAHHARHQGGRTRKETRAVAGYHFPSAVPVCTSRLNGPGGNPA